MGGELGARRRKRGAGACSSRDPHQLAALLSSPDMPEAALLLNPKAQRAGAAACGGTYVAAGICGKGRGAPPRRKRSEPALSRARVREQLRALRRPCL
jgi:hypothetical protein